MNENSTRVVNNVRRHKLTILQLLNWIPMLWSCTV